MRLIFLRLCLLASLVFPLAAQAEGRSIIVLDASGSMWGQIDGRTKIDIAREALAGVIADLPADSEMGLMAYGHREKGSCEDIELIVEPGKGTGQAILDAANALQFKGKTPLTESVRRAAAALRSSEEKATVILITDGIETCQADPCALGDELEASGVDFTAHVVGFGLSAEEGKQVSCLAEKTGGVYIEASDLASLTKALEATVIEAVVEPEPEPVPEPDPAPAQLDINFAPKALLAPGVGIPDDSADVVWEIHAVNSDGSTGERLTTEYNDYKGFVEPGTYRLITILGTVENTSDITLTADTLLEPEIILNAARVILHPKATADGPVDEGAALNFTTASGIDTTGYGSTQVYLPAGEVIVTATLGQGSVIETLQLAPGQLLEKDVVLGTGLAVIDAYYTEGMIMDTTQHSVEILAAKKALDGSRTSLTTGYGPGQKFDLPPGDYVAIVTQGAASAEVPFSIKTGERVDVAVILNAGVLAVTAPGAHEITVYAAKADINGDRKQVGFDYAEEQTFTLPEGDYLATSVQGEAKTEAAVTVKKGERTEVTLTLP